MNGMFAAAARTAVEGFVNKIDLLIYMTVWVLGSVKVMILYCTNGYFMCK